MNWIYSIAFKITGESKVEKASRAVGRLEKRVDKVGSSSVVAGTKMSKMGDRGVSAFSRLRSHAVGFLSVLAITSATMSSLNAAAEMEGIKKAISFASAGDGAKNLEFLNQTVDALGLNLKSSADGFKKWLGGVQGTSLEGQKARDVFYSVAEASTAMGLSGEQSNGVFLALSQMASKGKIQAEELRGQLGERLPGAFNIASRAMGMSTSELDKMMASGKLMAEDFLPKFAKELHTTFAQAAVDASTDARANFNRLGTAITNLQVVIGQQLIPVVVDFLQRFLIPAIDWIGRNIEVVGGLIAVLGSMFVASKLIAAGFAIAKFAAGGFKLSILGVNAAMWANPISIVILALTGLAVGIIYAWNKSEKFRSFLVGMWEVLKETGKLIFEWLTAPLKVFGKILAGVFTLDKEMIKSGLQDAADLMQNTILKAGERIGKAYNTGFEKGANAKAIKVPGLYKSPDALSSEFANRPNSGGSSNGNGGSNSNATIKNGIQGITGGGKQTKNISINLGNLVEEITIQANNVTEGADEIANIVLRKLTQSLNMANQVQ